MQRSFVQRGEKIARLGAVSVMPTETHLRNPLQRRIADQLQRQLLYPLQLLGQLQLLYPLQILYPRQLLGQLQLEPFRGGFIGYCLQLRLL